jgi:hypothetical protein
MNTNPNDKSDTGLQRAENIMEGIKQSLETLMLEDSKSSDNSNSESKGSAIEGAEDL